MSILPNSQDTPSFKYDTLYESETTVIGKCFISCEGNIFLHYHDVTEIYVITGGTGEVFNQDKWVNARVGDVFTFPPKVIHGAKTDFTMELTYVFNKGPFSAILYHKSKL